MNEREKNIHLWFEMWLTKQDLGIDNIFAEDVIYTESWGPKYNNRQIVKHWFQEWNTRGKVVAWEIKQFFHKGNQTIVEWYFKNEMNNGSIEEFDGISLVEWTKDNKIKSLKEFGCNLNNYKTFRTDRQNRLPVLSFIAPVRAAWRGSAPAPAGRRGVQYPRICGFFEARQPRRGYLSVWYNRCPSVF